jgi:hypothetical protein
MSWAQWLVGARLASNALIWQPHSRENCTANRGLGEDLGAAPPPKPSSNLCPVKTKVLMPASFCAKAAYGVSRRRNTADGDPKRYAAVITLPTIRGRGGALESVGADYAPGRGSEWARTQPRPRGSGTFGQSAKGAEQAPAVARGGRFSSTVCHTRVFEQPSTGQM